MTAPMPLVVIEGNKATRYFGVKVTHKAELYEHATPEDIEQFRVNPESVPEEPEAA